MFCWAAWRDWPSSCLGRLRDVACHHHLRVRLLAADQGEALVEQRHHLGVARPRGRAAYHHGDQPAIVAYGRRGEVEPRCPREASLEPVHASVGREQAVVVAVHATTIRKAGPREISIILGPEYYRYFSRPSFSYRGRVHGNHNRLLASYRGMDGLKTGFTRASGFNLAASAVRNNRRLIAVVVGGATSRARDAKMVALLDKGFSLIGRQQPDTQMVVASHIPQPAQTRRRPVPPRCPTEHRLRAELRETWENGTRPACR